MIDQTRWIALGWMPRLRRYWLCPTDNGETGSSGAGGTEASSRLVAMLGSNLAFALRCICRARSKQPDLRVSGDSEHTHAVPGLEVRDRGGRQAWPLDHARAVCNNVCVCEKVQPAYHVCAASAGFMVSQFPALKMEKPSMS